MNDITVDSLIEQVRDLIRCEGRIVYDTPMYDKFRKELTEFVHANFFSDSENWELIQNNLIWKSTQHLTVEEANRILTGLENIKLKLLERKYAHKEPFWEYIHPTIVKISQNLHINAHYSDAVQNAFKEIESRVKKIRKQIDGQELDTSDLMMKTFNEAQPLLLFEDNSTKNGKNVQEGYKYILAGVMKGIRNPNAHENIEISKDDAIRKLILASLLMYKVDEAVKFSGIEEK